MCERGMSRCLWRTSMAMEKLWFRVDSISFDV